MKPQQETHTEKNNINPARRKRDRQDWFQIKTSDRIQLSSLNHVYYNLYTNRWFRINCLFWQTDFTWIILTSTWPCVFDVSISNQRFNSHCYWPRRGIQLMAPVYKGTITTLTTKSICRIFIAVSNCVTSRIKLLNNHSISFVWLFKYLIKQKHQQDVP